MDLYSVDSDEAMKQFLSSAKRFIATKFFLSVTRFIAVTFYEKTLFNALWPLLFERNSSFNASLPLLFKVTLPTSASGVRRVILNALLKSQILYEVALTHIESLT
jgi:hypothetical protein